ncbi:hypothetical protein [Paraburkholderia sp. HD33-4]|uniref:hypothetical protein n=1 Tax=Paraburkholderia sp. HD33-4 TaxID=2883242 RepID=UPI001F1DF3D2|nr:hypothetical protein [Paraburkholderia sp. HD33-4]
MKAVRNHNYVVKELTHIGTLPQRLEQPVQRDCVDWLGTVFASPSFSRARIEANAELPAAPPPQAPLLLATLEPARWRRAPRRPDVIIAHRHY